MHGVQTCRLSFRGLKALGVKISIENGYVIADGSNLIGNKIHFPKISVGATGNIVMVAILAKGTTTITNAASEPEIQQLCEMLNSMGQIFQELELILLQ